MYARIVKKGSQVVIMYWRDGDGKHYSNSDGIYLLLLHVTYFEHMD